MESAVSVIISGAPTIFTALAFGFSVYTVRNAIRWKRSANTLDIWKIWIGKDYREYRVVAFHAIIDFKASRPDSRKPNLSDLLKDKSAEEAIGSIEHIFYETSEAIKAGLLDEKLFIGLFGRSASDWSGLLGGFNRDGAEAFKDGEMEEVFRLLLRNGCDHVSRYAKLPEPPGDA